ncbi:sortase domain-containing protein [Sphingomicrobium flavum]|uniref:sortase domain-containing protein n=1 Tax=Sphingomicrobium flavum TaxID=1229164 RepID=UPI0021AD9509|nr:sortase [Sphingomicrobium flavum]
MWRRVVKAGGWALALSGAALSLHAGWMPAKAEVAQILLHRAFEKGVASDEPVRPWRWADMEVVGRLSHAGLDKKEVILRGGAGQAMAFGPADIPTRNARVRMLSAHQDTHFRWLQRVEIGDRLRLETISEGAADYEIIATDIRRFDAFAFPVDPAAPLLILTTCYPFDAETPGPLRFIVWARKVEA